jgi:hypothetical protein
LKNQLKPVFGAAGTLPIAEKSRMIEKAVANLPLFRAKYTQHFRPPGSEKDEPDGWSRSLAAAVVYRCCGRAVPGLSGFA